MIASRLHITNGDGAAEIIRASGIDGDVLPWRDPMHHGPFPPGLDLDAVSVIRADYLAGDVLEVDAVRADFADRDQRLRNALTRGDAITLWFEHDLLDQLQLVQILDFVSAYGNGGLVDLICIGDHPQVHPFRGLGQLNAAQIAALWPTRAVVTDAELALASRAWAAFRAEDPTGIENLLQDDTHALAFLAQALRRHLQEFPWTSDGLTRTERQLLRCVSKGKEKPGALFTANMNVETALFIGDWSTFRIIAELCEGEVPLLTCQPDGKFSHPPRDDIDREAFRAQRLSLTSAGERVLSGEARWTTRRNQWLGGVHCAGAPPRWMWDEKSGSMRRSNGGI
ncbi:MAG: hypothetical protein AAFZ01_01140 [Pseudomonadota bacterium]